MLACKTPLVAVLALALVGCAAKPPPSASHRWLVDEKVNHIPMQGLPARPRTVADTLPLQIVNFDDESARDSQRSASMARGAAYGAAVTTIEAAIHLAPILPLCVFVAPLCVGVVAAGGMVGASQSALTAVPQEAASRLARIATEAVHSETLSKWTSERIQAPASAPEYPRLTVRVDTVLLVPVRDGITFRVVVSAQGSPSADQSWEPSIHYTQLPTRSPEEWLRSDGAVLRSDLGHAVWVLARHLGPLYIPYEQR